MQQVLILTAFLFSLQLCLAQVSIEETYLGNQDANFVDAEIVSYESLTQTPPKPNTTYALHFTIEFGKRSDNKLYNFNGTLKFFFLGAHNTPQGGTQTTIAVDAIMKNGTTFKRSTDGRSKIFRDLAKKMTASFLPKAKSPFDRGDAQNEINIKSLLITEDVKVATPSGNKFKVNVTSIDRIFTGAKDGYVYQYSETEFNQVSEKTRNWSYETDAAMTAHASMILMTLSLLIVFWMK